MPWKRENNLNRMPLKEKLKLQYNEFQAVKGNDKKVSTVQQLVFSSILSSSYIPI